MSKNREDILIEALPYIQQYNDKIIVVKYGGGAMGEEELKSSVMSDIALLHQVGIKVVLVHGGGAEITKTLDDLGIQTKFIDGLRYTDKESVKVVQMVLAGKTNKDLVKYLSKHGVNSIGISGIDANLLLAEKITSIDLGYVGDIVKVNTKVITDILDNGYIPVIASLAIDENGEVYNVNADTAAAKIAAALHAENLILLTDVDGLLEDVNNPNSLITKVKLSEVEELKNKGIIAKGMIPKIDCCVESINIGVKKAFITNGTIKHSILIEMLSDDGIGTMVVEG